MVSHDEGDPIITAGGGGRPLPLIAGSVVHVADRARLEGPKSTGKETSPPETCPPARRGCRRRGGHQALSHSGSGALHERPPVGVTAARRCAKMCLVAMTVTSDPDIAMWRLARAGVDDLLGLIHADDWTRSTPCTEWNVRDLLNHLVGSNWRYVALLRGGSEREFWRVRAEEEVLGDDPVVDWTLSADALDAAFVEPGAMERPIDFRLSTGRALLRGRVFDVTVHSWDLAQAVGADFTLDERLVTACLTTPFAAILARGEGMPATEDHEQLAARPARALPEEASDEERLLWLCGRKTSS